jgi:hypothetical protein
MLFGAAWCLLAALAAFLTLPRGAPAEAAPETGHG